MIISNYHLSQIHAKYHDNIRISKYHENIKYPDNIKTAVKISKYYDNIKISNIMIISKYQQSQINANENIRISKYHIFFDSLIFCNPSP